VRLAHDARAEANIEALLVHEAKALAKKERDEARTEKEKIAKELKCKSVLIRKLVLPREMCLTRLLFFVCSVANQCLGAIP